MNVKAASLEEICRFPVELGNTLTLKELHSFKRSGISNAVYGTEDDLLWQDANDKGCEMEYFHVTMDQSPEEVTAPRL